MTMKRLVTKLFQEKKLSEILCEYRWLYRYGQKYKVSIFYFISLGILGTLLGLAGSVISKNIIDAVTGYNTGGLVMAIVFYVCFQAFNLIVSALNQRVSVGIELKVDQEIRADIYCRNIIRETF